MHDPQGGPRSTGRGLAAALGTWVVTLAGPALAVAAPREGLRETAEGEGAGPGVAELGEGEGSEPEAEAAGGSAEPEVAAPKAIEPEATEPEAAETKAIEPEAAESKAAEPKAIEPEATEPEAAEPDAAEGEPAEPTSAPKPPRIDGTYLGGTMLGGIGLVRVNAFDTPGAFASFGGTFTVGQMVFPWLGIGLHGGGGGAVHSQDGVRQKLGQGHLGVQFKFVPLPKRRVPLSLLASFGFGGGAVRQEGIAKRSGFGGAQFGAAVRYELFPWAARRRPYRGGGFGLGPELGWVGFTPAAPGRPMSNVIYLAISATFYFGS